jgi:DNA-binding PadR family transcriptional regulator
MENTDPHEFLPLSATDFQLLLALTAGELHGYAISKSVRLGLVEESESDDGASGNGPARRKYRLTALGRAVLRAEVSRLSDAVELARSSQLFGDRKA